MAGKVSSRKYRLAHPEKAAAAVRRYHEAHRSEILPRKRLRAKALYADQERRLKMRCQQAEWYQKNKAKVSATGKIYRLKNGERLRKNCRDWHKKNRSNPKFIEQRRIRDRAYQQKRRALKKKAAINLALILQWMKQVKAKKIVTCYWCQVRFSSAILHFDHIIALSLGGPHEVENLCVSCPKCNLSKTNKPVRTWITIGQQMLEL